MNDLDTKKDAQTNFAVTERAEILEKLAWVCGIETTSIVHNMKQRTGRGERRRRRRKLLVKKREDVWIGCTLRCCKRSG
jgi:hypothetical protein